MMRNRIKSDTITVLLCIIMLFSNAGIAFAATEAYSADNPIALSTDHLQCTAGVLIDANTGKMLFGKNSKLKVYPASTTKIMTALLALEHGNLADVVTAGNEAGQIPGDSSVIPIAVGEQMTLKDLLYGTMINSGNDGANVIAAHIAGSVSEFVVMMNEKAAELGCEGTNFKNPHGYTDNDHYTTPRDLARITQEAMKNPVFRQIVSTTSYTIPASNKRDKPLVIQTKNKFLIRNENTANTYPYGVGVKTGYTSQAQHTFVGAAEKDGMLLIAAVFHSTKEGKWIDAARLMEYGFAAYRSVNIAEIYERSPLSVSIDGASLQDGGRLTLALDTASGAPAILIDTPENIESVTQNFTGYINSTYNQKLTAPVKEGDVMGEVTVSLPGGDTYKYPLLASRSIASGADSGGYADGSPTQANNREPTSIEEIAKRAAQSPLANIGNWWWTVPTAMVIILGGWSLLSLSQRRKRLDDVRRRRKRYSKNSSGN